MTKTEEIEAIISGMIVDLLTASQVLREYEESDGFHENIYFRKGVFRLCLFSIILNLNKYVELIRKYHIELKSLCPLTTKVRNLLNEQIKNKGVCSFRNDYIAHIQNDSRKQILTSSEVDSYLMTIVGADAKLFLEWIYLQPNSEEDKKNSVVGVLELVQDELSGELLASAL